jgi:hypothetical protein
LFALAKLGLVVQVRDGRELRHFAGAGMPEQGDYLAAFLRDPAKVAVLRLLSYDSHLSIHQMAKAIGLPFGSIKRILNQLHALDLIVMERRRFRYSVRMNPHKLDAITAALASG